MPADIQPISKKPDPPAPYLSGSKVGRVLRSILSFATTARNPETSSAEMDTRFFDRKARQASLEEEIIQVSPNPIIVLDQDLRWVSCNRAGEKRVGRDQERLKGHPFEDLIPKEDQGAFHDAVNKLGAGHVRMELHLRPFGAVTPTLMDTVIRRSSGEPHYLVYMTEMTESREIEDFLRIQLSAIQASPIAIMVADARRDDHPVLFVKKGFETLTGYESDEVIDRSPWVLHGAGTDKTAQENLRHALRHGEAFHDRMLHYPKKGEPFWCDFQLIPYHDVSGQLTHYVGILNDLSREKRFELEHERVNKLLLKSHGQLEEFVYIASHDLQEPLRATASFLQLLERRYADRLDDKGIEFIQHALDGTVRMRQLIMDLLTLSRAGTSEITLEPIALSEVFQEILSDLEYQFGEQEIQISSDPLPEILADRSQIGQLLDVLIHNAIKFRGEEPPRIHLSVSLMDKEWVFRVSDNGIGIDPGKFDVIFKPFQRLHFRSQYDGSGIGLAICRKIIDRHNGRIWLESKLGEGSTFFFSIPEVSP